MEVVGVGAAGSAGSLAPMRRLGGVALAATILLGFSLSAVAGIDPFSLLSEVPFAVVGAVLVIVTSLVLSSVAVGVALFTGAWALAFLAFATIPIAIGIAVFRYRLYDIDRLISRTLVYGVLAALLAVAYIGSVLLLSSVLAPLTSENSLAVAGGTLLVAALFAPVRRRIQSVVDRRFDRARYDGARELSDLSQRLRSEIDLEGVKAEVVATIGRTLAPSSASIWLRSERQGEPQ